MPGFTTHYIGGTLTLSQLQRCTLKSSISSHRSAYQLGLQGPDIFFYNLFNLISKSRPSLGSIMHTKRTGLFIQNCLDTIMSAPKDDQSIMSSYLSGFLCHYCLDTQCHPYIYFKSGYKQNSLNDTMNMNPIYYSKHLYLENVIDSLIGCKYPDCLSSNHSFKQSLNLHPKTIRIISELLSTCIRGTYSIATSPRLIRNIISSFSMEHNCLSSLRHKRVFIQKIEERYLGYPLLSAMIPSDQFKDLEDALNLQASTWHSPWQPTMAKDDTFLVIFEKGIKRCTNLLDALNSYLLTLEDSFMHAENQCILYKQFMNMIGSQSYHSGLLTY